MVQRHRMPFLPSGSARQCVGCAGETWSLEGAWQVLEVAVGSGGPGPLPPGDGGRGLHSGGGAETAAGHNLNHAPGVLEDRIVMRNKKTGLSERRCICATSLSLWPIAST